MPKKKRIALKLFLLVCKLSILTIKLKYPLQVFDLLRFILYNFYESEMFHVN